VSPRHLFAGWSNPIFKSRAKRRYPPFLRADVDFSGEVGGFHHQQLGIRANRDKEHCASPELWSENQKE